MRDDLGWLVLRVSGFDWFVYGYRYVLVPFIVDLNCWR
jgi:hypothetical protein